MILLASIPLGAEINIGLQIVALVLLLVGLRYAILTHNGIATRSKQASSTPAASNPVERVESIHKNVMTLAVVVSGLGVIIWMVPSLILGWFYSTSGLGFGSGGYLSYFKFGGVYNAHWYLIDLMIVVGTLTSILGVYLVLRMRISSFPKAISIQNFKGLMIVTWSLWIINIFLGFAVFYLYAFLQTG